MTPDLQTLQAIAATNRWSALAPELVLGGFALLLLALEFVLPKRALALATPRVALLGFAASLAWTLRDWAASLTGQPLFGGLLLQTPDSQVMRVFFLAASALVAFIAAVVLPKHKAPRVEFYHILLVATGALMLLAQSNHFVLLFVALETVTVSFFILVAFFRESPFSLEAGLKYLVTGSLSSALLLFGIVLLYGVAGNPLLEGHTADGMNFDALNQFLLVNPDHPLALVGAALVLCGLAFKIGAVPFQIWVPDVYQGAPTPVTAFLAVSSKAAGFAVLLILVRGPFQTLAYITVPLLSIFAALSLLFGNLAALG
ncbi:MAG TPA: proton-conducting transporter membrane subunit, partial [Opitutaceae bacterium]|nr:proton-conducting transporter membrane subunit [Opitutaceae bacterium]